MHDFDQIRELDRPCEVPDAGLLCDLLWSDPDKGVEGWGDNERGVSFTFGADVVTKFLNKHGLDLVCRAHQVIGEGGREGGREGHCRNGYHVMGRGEDTCRRMLRFC